MDMSRWRAFIFASTKLSLVSESHEAANGSLQPLVSEAGRTKRAAGKMFLSTARRGCCRYTAVYVRMAPKPDERALPLHGLGKAERSIGDFSGGISWP